MSESRSTQDEYLLGSSRGYKAGKETLAEGRGLQHEDMIGIRGIAEAARTPGDRAYHLGFLRGYRDAVRTLLDGRWGT